MKEYTDLALACAERSAAWVAASGQQIELPLSYWGNEMAGETGEACNVIKKLERERYGMPGSRAGLADLASELADVIITATNAANAAGINLTAEVSKKFNETSRKVGLDYFMKETA